MGYKTEKFPEFFLSDSGYKNSTSIDNEIQCAELIHMQFDRLNLKTGILITVPVPQEQEANN